MKLEALVHELEKAIEADHATYRARAIFGEPVKLALQTIVPVGVVVAANGRDLKVQPLGFVHELCGCVRFTSIETGDGNELDPSCGRLIDLVRQRCDELVARRLVS